MLIILLLIYFLNKLINKLRTPLEQQTLIRQMNDQNLDSDLTVPKNNGTPNLDYKFPSKTQSPTNPNDSRKNKSNNSRIKKRVNPDQVRNDIWGNPHAMGEREI